MTTTNFTTSLGLALPTTGDLSGTWGDTVNDYISKYLDTAVAGALTVNSDVTLAKTTNSALGATSSQYAILIASGHSTNITVTAPAISKVYLVINKSGAYTAKIRGAGPTTGITVPVSTAALVAWDGSDFALVSSTDINSLSNVLTAVKGGTGQSSYAVGDLLYASTTTALSKLADVATGNALISGGVGVAPSYGKIGLTTHVDGTLGVANGGTGAASLTLNNVLLGNGTSAVQFVAPGTNGNVLTSNGTTWTSAAVASALSGVTQSTTPFETSLGFEAGLNTTGVNTTFVGYTAGKSNTTGTDNTAVGYRALLNCVTGISNTAVGANTAVLATGSYNSSFGANCGGSTTGTLNVAFGWNALNVATSASESVAIGARALQQETTGANNTAVGSSAMVNANGASNNVAIGRNAASGLSTGSNNIVIGYNASASSATVSNEITLGNTSTATLRCQVTTITSLSDARDKANIRDLSAGLNLINALRAVAFDWNTRDGGKVGVPDTGFIAQELQAAQVTAGVDIPGLVYDNDPECLGAGYGKLIPVLVKAIQELAAEVALLKQR